MYYYFENKGVNEYEIHPFIINSITYYWEPCEC